MTRATVAAVALFFLSCEKNGPTVFEPLFGGVDFQAGRTFVYAWSGTMVDSLGTVLWSESDTVTVVVTGTNETLDSLTGLTVIDDWSNGFPFVGTTWYQKTDDAFIEIAYRNPGGIIAPPSLQTTPLHFPVLLRRRSPVRTPAVLQLLGKELRSDSIQFRTDPRVVYRFPLTPGKSWISFTDPFLQTREVKQDTTIWISETPEDCATILTRIPDLSPRLEWYDYVNRNGLIRRTITFPGIIVPSPENPEIPIGTAAIYEHLEPISIRN